MHKQKGGSPKRRIGAFTTHIVHKHGDKNEIKQASNDDDNHKQQGVIVQGWVLISYGNDGNGDGASRLESRREGMGERARRRVWIG